MAEIAFLSEQWWTEPLGTWMAWTRATIAFFVFIAGAIATMGLWEYFSPGGSPRRGILALDTTRGDRLFIGLLGSAYILMAWIFFFGTDLTWALVLCVFWLLVVFRKV
jgi:predicted small integral membrane protein